MRTDEVRPGYYRFRRVRGGPWIAAHVTIMGDRIRVAENGAAPTLEVTQAHYAELVSEQIADGAAFNHPLLRVIWFGEPIERLDHDTLVAVRRWAIQHDRRHPAARPDKPIDLGELPVDLIV